MMSLIEKVSTVLRKAAAEAILPRFRKLAASDVEEKSPGELVTAADHHAEQLIGEQLLQLYPSARIVGEEACARNPALASALDQGTVWLIDPLDGTGNFVSGRGPFSVMVALLRGGETVATWMLDPLSGQLHVAELGSGAQINGVRVVADGKAEPLRKGSISMRFFPPEVLEAVKPRLDQVPLIVPPLLCAGAEYPAIVARDRDFAVFWRTLPWDHLPGALFLSEAGGHVARWNGSPYRAGQDGYGLLAARTPDHWRVAHKALLEVMTI
ncbi:inositol monophosphatase family protein [Bosea thiooxidans]|uniref:Fructose-1,6-bisphosphatase n=1 Tax=Bosea thiooxidans TaxID=53254 RepID=A0A1T5DW14_9HYPH|nr:inositol monophosphatase [Bosea thiooxidans]SKB75834.1 fructose-1,6-bisphosphatase [Bosea thiooxidans]